MNTPRYAAAAARLLNRHITRPQLVVGDRERGLANIEHAMQARARRRRVVWGASALAAAAALVLAVQGARSFASAAVSTPLVAIDVSPAGRGAALRAGDHAQPLAERSLLEAGQRIDTPADGGASLHLSTGTSMDLAGKTAFRVDSQGAVERFSLERGELSAHVAKLTSGQRFIIATPDAEVEVRGTRFRVDVLEQGEACGNGTRTRLEVTEGRVEVRHAGSAIQVRAGEHWPLDCAVGKAAASQPVLADPPVGSHAAIASVQRAPAALTKAVEPSNADATPRSATERASALAEQNDLFAEGVAKRRQGDVSGALRVYQELMSRFPRSPLAENALVERMRLLAASHDGSARAEAERYLARYPHGFAAKEAQQLTAVP